MCLVQLSWALSVQFTMHLQKHHLTGWNRRQLAMSKDKDSEMFQDWWRHGGPKFFLPVYCAIFRIDFIPGVVRRDCISTWLLTSGKNSVHKQLSLPWTSLRHEETLAKLSQQTSSQSWFFRIHFEDSLIWIWLSFNWFNQFLKLSGVRVSWGDEKTKEKHKSPFPLEGKGF
jgi:hypothetical protein